MLNKTSLPDAAYAIGCELPHHTDSVTKPTENATVDMDMLKDCLSKVGALLVSPAEKTAVIDHLKDHARALDLEDEEVESLIGEAAALDYDALIDAVDTFVAAEDIFLKLADAEADNRLLEKAHAKMVDLAKVNRELIEEEFDGVLINKPTKDEDGLWRFTALVAQADKVNNNKRLYPKAEFANNLSRVNRLCKAGKFTGRDGHACWSDDKPTEICVRYDAVMLQGDDLIMEGVLIPTQAGQDIATLWSHGVNTEWSIVGYGNVEYQTDEKGNITHSVITDYILNGCDPVRRGSANTRTLKLTKPKDELEVEEVEVVAEAVDETVGVARPVEEPTMGEELNTVEETVEQKEPETKAPEVDLEAIVAEAVSKAGESAAKVAAEAAVAAAKLYHEEREKSQALEAAKSAAIGALTAADADLGKIVAKHFDGCQDVEEVKAKVEEITPLVQSMKRRMDVASIGIHTGNEKETAWFNGQTLTDRPETVHEVKRGLLEGIEDTGAQNWGNKHYAFKQVLDNYERLHPEYFRACTKRGYMETATTSTVLGTTLPYVLPMIRQIFPKLIPYEIQSVQPLPGPTGRVYFLDFKYGSGASSGSNMYDSSVFDSTWTDHTEGDTKAQVTLGISHTDLEAEEKSIYYDITSILMQDMKALYNLDAEAELLQAGASEIARELNLQYLETIALGAGVDAGTYGYNKPTAWDSQEKWYDQGFSMWTNYASSLLMGKKFQADWVFCGPTQAKLFASSLHWEASQRDPNEFGYGIKRMGTYDGQLTVYSVSWAEAATSVKNKLIFGFYPQDWMHTGSVFAPYIPLYVSPQDSDASKNLLSRSLSSRNAMKVLQSEAFAKLTVANATGTEVPFID